MPASIVDKNWLLIAVKDNGKTIKFSQVADSCFIVRFSNKRFKGWNGNFFITGVSKDAASSYFLPSPLTGFYSIKPENKIGLYWFSNISWAMHFDYSSNSKLLERAFQFDGAYVLDGERLYLITNSLDLIQRDTSLILARF
ncbi:MAG: hypothetical protein IPP79_08405 [Chitinophagaceae bacterium]|nr:hypothetical protein [Chitinophagaceae bacterium]